MATPLHNHTYYSAYDGLSKPRQIASRVTQLGMGACGCTDHDVVAGHLEFYKVMKEAGVKPLLGIETYQSPVSRFENYGAQTDKVTKQKVDNFHLLLLAMNEKGLHNLWAMNTEAHDPNSFYHHGRVDWELLKKYNEGIIATSACSLGLLQQAIRNNSHIPDADTILHKYLDIFGDRFYIELGTYPAEFQYEGNLGAIELAKSYGVNVVYGNDAHYASPDQYKLHEEIVTLQKKKKVKDLEEPNFKQALYIMGEDEVRHHLNYLPTTMIEDALSSSDAIADRCNVELPAFKQHVPVFIPDGYKNSRDMLLDLVEKGFGSKIESKGKDVDLYFDRVQNELKVIFSANLVDYLLMVRDYCLWADDHNIMRGPGRGSAGGSLICYLLDIVDVDPLRYDLIFERFYNIGRETSLPDIDIDFAKAGRESIKKYIMDRYGAEYVSDIGTVIRLQPKSAILDVARVQSVPMMDAQAISKILDKGIKAGLQPTWETIQEKLGSELAPWQEKYPNLFEDAEALLETYSDAKDDQVKSYGIHATGVLVADVPLGANFPLRCATETKTKKKKMVSQWDMRDAETLGFMKIDLCGLRNLDTLTQLNKILVTQDKQPIDFKGLQDEEFPEEMWQLLDRGATTGLFQVEEEALVKQIAKQMKPRSIEDLAVLVAMNRPGPLQSKDAQGRSAIERYMTGRHTGDTDYLNEVVAKVTSNTHGIFLYQEQIINFMVEIGYSLLEADDVRSMMGKKKKEKLDAEYGRYFPRACDKMSAAHANEVWEQLKNFAEYGFNKSHAVEYAIILLWTLYAKWRYPAEFLVASIITVDKDQKARYVNEAKRLKIPVYGPEFGKARAHCSIWEDGIMLGYGDIMGIGEVPAAWLEKFTFSGISKEEFVSLVEENKHIQANGKKAKAVKADVITNLSRLSLFVEDEPPSKEDLLGIEEELLKVAISDDSAKILEEHSDTIDEHCTPYALIDEPGEYTIAGVIREIHNGKTKHNKPYAKIKIGDDSDEIEFFVWNENLKRLSFIFRNRMAGLFYIKKNPGGLSLMDAAILYPKDQISNPYVNSL